jgi:hypothetical protein
VLSFCSEPRSSRVDIPFDKQPILLRNCFFHLPSSLRHLRATLWGLIKSNVLALSQNWGDKQSAQCPTDFLTQSEVPEIFWKWKITPGRPGLTARMKRLSAGNSIGSRSVHSMAGLAPNEKSRTKFLHQICFYPHLIRPCQAILKKIRNRVYNMRQEIVKRKCRSVSPQRYFHRTNRTIDMRQ